MMESWTRWWQIEGEGDFRFMLDLVFIPWEWFGHTMCERKEFHELFLA